jgi:hypothetical protein
MKKEANIDEVIKQALSDEESEFLERLGEQSLMEEGLGLLKGRRGWISIWIGFVILIVFVGSIYCLMQFFDASEVKELMVWGGGFFLGIFMVTALKIWAWMQMDRNAIIREIKRLEVQLTALHLKK